MVKFPKPPNHYTRTLGSGVKLALERDLRHLFSENAVGGRTDLVGDD
jgi:hypothetical protein